MSISLYNLGIVITAYATTATIAAPMSAMLQKYRLELFLSLLIVQIVAQSMYFS
jgi:predicted MFS family arabinose efflux permease